MNAAQLSPRRQRTISHTASTRAAADHLLREAAFVLHLTRQLRDDILGDAAAQGVDHGLECVAA